jgi:hypothetical protein
MGYRSDSEIHLIGRIRIKRDLRNVLLSILTTHPNHSPYCR